MFDRRWLQTASTLKPLRQGGFSLGQVLDELSRCGMIQRVGRGHLVCTAEGDLTKHCFNDLLAEGRVQGAVALLSRDKLARTAALRVAMRLYVEGKTWAEIKAEIEALQ